jgi:hypothetical protein
MNGEAALFLCVFLWLVFSFDCGGCKPARENFHHMIQQDCK